MLAKVGLPPAAWLDESPGGRREVVVVGRPATSANLGPGFDCFGLALDWCERVTLRTESSGFRDRGDR